MLVIETYVAPSKIHGLGLYTRHRIAKGQLVWHHESALERFYTDAEVDALPQVGKDFLNIYGYRFEALRPDGVFLDLDNSRYMNHNDSPNIISNERLEYIAVRDIEAGEELTCNYAEFDPDFVAHYMTPEKANGSDAVGKLNGNHPVSVTVREEEAVL